MPDSPTARTDPAVGRARGRLRTEFANRVAIAVLIAIGLIALAIVVWYAIYVFLLAFAGILFAVLLRATGDGVSVVTRLSKGWALALGSLVLVAGMAAGIWFFTPRIAVQAQQLRETLPAAMEQLGQYLQQYEWGRIVLQEAQKLGDIPEAVPAVAAGAANMIAATTTMLIGFVVAFFIGIFLTINPGIYVRGTVRLFPISSRPRAVEMLEATELTLRWWLVGRIIAMAFVGVATALTLWLLGVPLSLLLGLLAAVLDFVPNVGPLIAVVPAVLIAFGEGPETALYVIIAYFVIQQVESYVVTPIVQQKVVSLPPAFTVFVQVLFTLLAGPIGLLLATPLAAAGLVLVRGLYVQDVLGDKEVGLTD